MLATAAAASNRLSPSRLPRSRLATQSSYCCSTSASPSSGVRLRTGWSSGGSFSGRDVPESPRDPSSLPPDEELLGMSRTGVSGRTSDSFGPLAMPDRMRRVGIDLHRVEISLEGECTALGRSKSVYSHLAGLVLSKDLQLCPRFRFRRRRPPAPYSAAQPQCGAAS